MSLSVMLQQLASGMVVSVEIFLTVWDVWQLFGTLALFILKI